ncbi:PH domain-containing protein [Candidatus Woesearchaeota archaeon]|nr:PH domain-containing protein [Candidatus Woesearchaeota archaeon]
MEQQPLFILKPQLSVAIIPTILFGILISIFVSIYAVPTVVYTMGIGSAVFAGILIFVVIIGLTVFFRLMNLRARRYLFFKNKAEFYEGFLNIIQHTVSYQKVTDCVLTKSVWDRMFGTGTIRLVTAGHESRGRYSVGGGIAIQFVENPNQVYKELQKLLGMHQ